MNQNEQQPERTAIAARIDQKSSVILSGANKNTPTMANDNQTALMQSIQRKKDRVIILEKARDGFPAQSLSRLRLQCAIDELELSIFEDEKLLAVDKVKITGKWLEDHGFEFINSETLSHKKLHKLQAHKHIVRVGYGIFLEGFHTLPHIEYTYQVEELYFILTGELLTTNQPHGTDGK